MLLKINCIVFIINTLVIYSRGIQISERNETTLILSLNSKVSELREEQERYFKLTNGLLKAMDIQSLKTELERLKNEQDRLFKRSYLRNCADTIITGISDIIIPNFSSQPFTVFCDSETRGGGWTIILRRTDGSIDFNRTWNAYKKGFGDLGGEFFLGLDKIHALTSERSQELLVLLEDFDGIKAFETYDGFAIGDEDQQYVLHKLGEANGTAGDSLLYHHVMKFTTVDRDNDIGGGNCAQLYTGGWWYNSCFKSHLTGTYNNKTNGMGINWNGFRNATQPLKKAVMMIRPRK